MKVQASLKVLPNNYNSREENYKFVDEAIILIKQSGLEYEVGVSETTVEGDIEKVLKLVRDINIYLYRQKIKNIVFNIVLEYNEDEFYISDKKESIKKI